MTKYEKIAHETLMEVLTKAEINCVDTTWGNDVTASVGVGVPETDALWIYVPNAMVDDIDNEEFSTFSVCNEDGDILFTSHNIPDVVEFISRKM